MALPRPTDSRIELRPSSAPEEAPPKGPLSLNPEGTRTGSGLTMRETPPSVSMDMSMDTFADASGYQRPQAQRLSMQGISPSLSGYAGSVGPDRVGRRGKWGKASKRLSQ